MLLLRRAPPQVLLFFSGAIMDNAASFWPWYICGPLIGLYVPILYLLVNRHFGISSTFRDICAATLRPAKP